MKNLSIIFVFLFVLLIGACKKSDNNPESKYNYRLANLAQLIDDDVSFSVDFLYDGDRVIGWKEIDGSGSEFSVDVNYLENNVVEFDISEDIDGAVTEKMIYTFSNDLVEKVEELSKEDAEFVLDYLTTYNYNQNGDVTEIVESYFVDGTEQLQDKEIYSYNNDVLTETINYQWYNEAWRESTKVVYHYENGQLVNSDSYGYGNDIWNPYYKEEFVYLANGGSTPKVEKIYKYDFIGVDDWELVLTTTYQYDGNGNITLEEKTYSNQNVATSYTYDEKSGNLWLFGFNYTYGYPNPIYKKMVSRRSSVVNLPSLFK